jgi:hypothetical protein
MHFKSIFLLFIFLTTGSGILYSQSRGIDTTYIEDQPEKVILRYYFSRKYTELKYGNQAMVYEPNSGLNMGIGFTFQKFTLNLAAPVSFLNPGRQEDWPKFLDLQAHIYPTSWIIDFFGQFYTGYIGKDYYAPGEDYLRRDIRTVKLGASVSYLFNGEKMSFEAAIHQTAIQKKSAFSPMVGFEAYRVRIKGSELVLPEENGPIPGNYTRGDFYQVGPSAGLAGTLVLGKGFFITGAASGNLGLGFSKLEQDKSTRKVEVMTGYFLRGFAGYNGNRFSINGSYVYKQLNLNKQEDITQSANTGNYRINLIYKIKPSQKFVTKFSKFNLVRFLDKIKE